MTSDLWGGRGWRVGGLILLLCTLCAGPVWAQAQSGEIEGVVRDTSGAVLPGVTVTIASAALIERTRVTVTDNRGSYRFLRLPVGTYTIRYELPGFGTVERGNVALSSGFTATIHAELALGTVEETLTVTGESPLVDVRTTTQQFVMSSEVIDTIPSSRNVMDLGKFMVGYSTGRPEVAGSAMTLAGTGWQIHGSRGSDRSFYRDGVPTSSYFGSGDAAMSYGGAGNIEEANYQTVALPAWIPQGGISMSLVTKSGGNSFSGTLFGSAFTRQMQSSNLDDALRARGVRATSGGAKAYDLDMTFGGPIKQDSIWFFANHRVFSYTELLANQFDRAGNQMESYVRRGEPFGKITWQIDQNNRLAVSNSNERAYRPFRRQGATFVEPEAANLNTKDPFNYFVSAMWTSTPSSSLIFEVLASTLKVENRERYRPEVGPDDVARLDIVTSTLSGAPTRIREGIPTRHVFAASVTRLGDWLGSHELRVGGQFDWGGYVTENDYQGGIILRFRDGVPDSADLWNTPVRADNRVRQYSLYVQDRWMVGERLTVNAGARFDETYIWIAEQFAPAGAWVPERRTPKTPVRTFRNAVPRLGVAYDLTGRASTVLKGSFAKYMGNESTSLAETVNPLFQDSSNRCAWTDRSGDLMAQPDELSRCTGWSGGATTVLDPGLRRPYNNEYSLGIEQALTPSLRISVMAHRREQRDLYAIQNLAVPTESYIPVVITNPVSGQPLTIYNQNPATAGLQDNIRTNSSKLNTQYNGIEFSFIKRFGAFSRVTGGYHHGNNRGRIVAGELNDPNADIFADGAVGNDQPHQLKMSGNTRLPGSITFSGSVNVNTGHPRVRTLSVGRALVPGLTRATQTVRLEPNDDNRYDPWIMVDLRFGRVFTVGGKRFEPFVDVYNLMNANTVLNEVTAVGSNLGRVSQTINPRVIKIGGRLNF